ncbi:MAG: L-serine ammonia-lyase, iron-sulfur-dependent, subunit alpha [Hespellia sp.]|nr:L-serine ammonia-lyase, iron-sulfur-dependent, subunit alpha [Hespellia sp.]
MEQKKYQCYVSILQQELIPALGCTEPIALALAAAKAKEVLGEFPDKLEMTCSGNIIKNVKGVTVPNSGGLKGIEIAATLGCVGGNADEVLNVLGNISDEQRQQSYDLVSNQFCICQLKENVENLYIVAKAVRGEHFAEVTIIDHHNQIMKIVKDGEVLFEKNASGKIGEIDKAILSVEGIVEFANTVKMEDVEEVLERQIQYNTAISERGLSQEYGAQVGRTLLECYDAKDVKVKARAAAAAGSDARMSGCALPVIINSGSGNQGMTASLPVLEYAKEWNISKEGLYRALCVSNLIALEQKKYIGSLSAYCGAVCAACGAGAAITYMKGGDIAAIEATITNTIANVGGIVCDGAKPSCAAKIASAVDAAILGHNLAMKGRVFQAGEGLVQDNAQDTIKAFGIVGKEGMKQTDVEVLNLMLGNTNLESCP